MRCQSCGAELPSYPDEAILDGHEDEVVAHLYQGEERFSSVVTDYYCDPECFAAGVLDE